MKGMQADRCLPQKHHAFRVWGKDRVKGVLTKGAAFTSFAAWERSGEALVSSGS